MEKIRNKKLLLYVLALNSLLTPYSTAETSQQTKYDNLYKSMTKNLETGKSNEKNYELIEKVLNKRNKELKNIQSL